jgi:hypothetical protein
MKPNMVGQIVRFKSSIQAEHGGILSLERGIVVGFSADKRKTDVVWNDGERGTYWTRDLARMPGTVGDIAESSKPVVGGLTGKVTHQPVRPKPVKDRGHKPVPTPTRTIPTPLPRSGDEVTWTTREIKRVESIVSDKPHVDAKGKHHDTSFIKFSVPIVTIEVAGPHWAEDKITITRSRFGLTVRYGDGQTTEKVRSQVEHRWLTGRFGPEFASRFLSMCMPMG